MTITCFIRTQIDPFECDAKGRAPLEYAQAERFILREERTWLDDVSSTRKVARQVTP